MTTTTKNTPDLVAFYVNERNGKAYWTRIGGAWLHEDGKGYGLRLDLVPSGTANGRIVLRNAEEETETTSEGAGA